MSINSADIETYRKGSSGNIEYFIKVTVKKKRWTIAKTFNDFLKLNEFLQKNSGYHVKCNLSAPTTARRFTIILLESDTLAKQRQAELQSYLNVLIEDKTILSNSLVREFFEVESYVKNYDKEKLPQRKTLSSATAEQLLLAVKSMIEGQSDALSTFLQQAQIFNPTLDTTRSGSSISTVGTAPVQQDSSPTSENPNAGLIDSLRQFIDKERNDMKAKLAAANERIQDLTTTLKVQEVLVTSLQKKLSFATNALIAASHDSQVLKSPRKTDASLQRAEAHQHTPQPTVSADGGFQHPSKSSTKRTCTAEELKLNIRLSKSKSKLRGMLEKHALREAEMRKMIINLREAQRKMLGMVIHSYGTENDVCDKSMKSGKGSTGTDTTASAGNNAMSSGSKPPYTTPNHFESTDVDDNNTDGDAPPADADMRLSVMESISNSLSIANRLSGMGQDFELEADTLMQTVSPPLGDHLSLDNKPLDADGNVNEFGDVLEIVNIADDAFLQLNANTLEYERLCEDGFPVAPRGGMMDAVFQEPSGVSVGPISSPSDEPSMIGIIDSSPIAPSSTDSQANTSNLRRLFELTQCSPNSSVIFGLEDIYLEKSRYLAQTAPRLSQPPAASNLSPPISSPVPVHVSPAQQTAEFPPLDSSISESNQQQLAMLTALKQQLDDVQSRWLSFEDVYRDRLDKLLSGKSRTGDANEFGDQANSLQDEVSRLKAQNLDQERTLNFLQQELEIARSKDKSEMESIVQLLKSNLSFSVPSVTPMDTNIVSSHSQSSAEDLNSNTGAAERSSEVGNLQESLSDLISQVAYIGETQRDEFDARAFDLMQRIDAQEKTINDLLLINKTQQSILMSTEEAMNYMKVENDVDRSGLRGQVYDANSALREVKLLYQKAEEEKKICSEEVERLKKANGDVQETLSKLISTNQTQASALEFAQKELLALREQQSSLGTDTGDGSAEITILRSLHERLDEWMPSQDATAEELRSRVATSGNQSRSLDKLQQIQDTLDALLQHFEEQQGSSSLSNGDEVAGEFVKLTEAVQSSCRKLSTIESHLTISSDAAVGINESQILEMLSNKNRFQELDNKVTTLTVRYNSAVELNKRYEAEVLTLKRDLNHFKESSSESQRYINELLIQNKVLEEAIRTKKEELASCLQRIKDGGDYNQELEQSKISTEVEADSLREELQVYMQKVEQLKENNKQLDSTMRAMKAQYEREKGNLTSAQKSELEALHYKMEKTIEQLHMQHNNEISELQSRQKREIEIATKEKLNSVKSKVEHYVSELDADKQSLKDALVERDVEITRLQRHLELASIEIDRFKGKILSDSLAASKRVISTTSLNEQAPSNESLSSYSATNKPRYSPEGSTVTHPSSSIEPNQHKRKVTQQIAIEEVSISAKIKDPDQEALAAGILLSQQEAEYGTNMFESLRAEDEEIIVEYIKNGFTREEAILMIFQDKYKSSSNGKPQASRRQEIMAMPHLLRQNSVKKIAYEMNQTISQRHSRNYSLQEIGKTHLGHSRSPSLASVSQISLSRTSSNVSLGSLRDPYPIQPASRNSKFPEPFATPRSHSTITGVSTFSNTATSAGGISDQFHGSQSSFHKRHHSQFDHHQHQQQSDQGSNITRTYSLRQLSGHSNTPVASSTPSNVNIRSGGSFYSSQLSEEDMLNVAKIMKRTGLDRPQAVQVYLSQRTS